MRKAYLDDLKWIVILIVVIMHCLQIYYPRLAHYVKGSPQDWIGVVFAIFEVWLMPLMFTIAGISAAYSLKKRKPGEFAKSRLKTVLIPLIFGLIFVVPLQSYPGRIWHTGTSMSYPEHWFNFFFGETDLTGYSGGFGFSQYWFLLYLFIASMIYLLVYIIIKKISKGKLTLNMPVLALPLLFIPITLAEPAGNIMDYSFGYYTAFMIIGGFVLSDDTMQKKIAEHIPYFLTLAAATMILYIWNLYSGAVGHYGGPIRYACALCCTLAALGIGCKLNTEQGKIRRELSRRSFGIYQFHQIGLSWSALFLTGTMPFPAEISVIFIISFFTGLGITVALTQFRATRFMFGIK